MNDLLIERAIQELVKSYALGVGGFIHSNQREEALLLRRNELRIRYAQAQALWATLRTDAPPSYSSRRKIELMFVDMGFLKGTLEDLVDAILEA